MDKRQAVPLRQAVSEIQTSRRCDLTKARQIVKDADQVGDLEVRLLRPDGSTDQLLDVIANLWDNPDFWEELFRTGLFDAPARPTRWRVQDRRSMRRIQPDERCRIVVTRESLDAFLKAGRPSRAGRPDEHDWEEGKLFLRQQLERRGNPLKKENQVKGWKSISDAARLVSDHLSKDGEVPDFSKTRAKVAAWINEYEAEQN